MIDLTQNQIKELTIWAYEKLWDMVDIASYEGDHWFTYDGDKLPELVGKIDVNIWDDGEEGSIIQGAAYAIDILPDGVPNTNCENWVMLFGGADNA
jgi:hypothetical protein